MLRSKYTKLLALAVGSMLYAAGINIFIVPFQLFSGGVMGVSQLLNLPLERLLHWNITGLLYLVLNIPLLILAWKSIGKMFFFRTILGTALISLFMSLIPIPTLPVVDDCLVSVLIGGIISGMGIGLVLMMGGCSGGFDVVGIWASKKFRSASVGKITLVANAVIYCFLLLLFDLQTFIYSIIYMLVHTVAIDRSHFQSINLRLMIFTKMEDIDRKILEKTGRGVTEWSGVGAFSQEQTHVLVTCINKYEQSTFMEIIHSVDPNAFVIVDEGVRIIGNFEKRV